MDKTYRFYLFFKKDNIRREIAEPWQWSSFSQSAERKKDGWAIDIHLFAEHTDLLFTDSEFDPCDEFYDIDGTRCVHFNHGLKLIIDYFNEYGPDAQISLQVEFEDIPFIECEFDLEEVDTDLETFFQCGFIENNARSKFKKAEDDVVINIYADKDLDGNTITPLVPTKVLLLSTPRLKNSKWIKTDIPYASAPGGVTNKFPAGGPYRYFNFCKNPILFGIDDTLVPSAFDDSPSFDDTYNGNMQIIFAKSTKQNMTIKITSDVGFIHIQNGRTGFANKSSLGLYVRISYGTGVSDNHLEQLWFQEFTGTTPQSAIVTPVLTYDVPLLNEGQFVTVYWDYTWDDGTIALSADWDQIDNYSHVIFNDCIVEAVAVEKTINSAVQGPFWIEALKKAAEITSGLPVDAPRIDVGGEYHKTIICNGGGIRNIDSIPFDIKTKEIFETGMMVAIDYQVCKDVIRMGDYNDFHSDRVLRRFNVEPSEKFMWGTNKNYRIKTFNYNFDTFEQDRDESRTLDAVHTQEQLLLPNEKTQNIKTVKVKQILDKYKIDSLRRLGIDPDTEESSLENDNDLVFLNVEELENDHIEDYIGKFSISTFPGGIYMYTNVFKWTKIGIGLSSTFEILAGPNAGAYQITGITSNLLTLLRLAPLFNASQTAIIPIRYSLANVLWISRTDQGFANIQGVLSPETSINLFYSKGRNILKWLPYLATCGMRYLSEKLKVTFLKSNQDLVTRLVGEANDLVEKADIDISAISSLKKVTDRTFKINIFPENPIDMNDIFTELNDRNPDGSIGGCYEFRDINNNIVSGYPEKIEYIPNENKLEAECNEKYNDNDYIEILTQDRVLYSHFHMFGIYVTVYKADGTLFFTGRRYTKIKINGNVHTDASQFNNDLQYYFSL